MDKTKKLGTGIALMAMILIFLSCKEGGSNDMRMNNQTFVNLAYATSSFELAAGNLALSKGISENVKNYGLDMVEDHGPMSIEIAILAQAKGLQIPIRLQAKDEVKLEKLNEVDMQEFDKHFIQIMIDNQSDAVDLFSMAAGQYGVEDPDLLEFATEKLTTLKMNMESAGSLQSETSE